MAAEGAVAAATRHQQLRRRRRAACPPAGSRPSPIRSRSPTGRMRRLERSRGCGPVGAALAVAAATAAALLQPRWACPPVGPRPSARARACRTGATRTEPPRGHGRPKEEWPCLTAGRAPQMRLAVQFTTHHRAARLSGTSRRGAETTSSSLPCPDDDRIYRNFYTSTSPPPPPLTLTFGTPSPGALSHILHTRAPLYRKQQRGHSLNIVGKRVVVVQ